MFRFYGKGYTKEQLERLAEMLDHNIGNLMEECGTLGVYCHGCEYHKLCDDIANMERYIKKEILKCED